MTADAPRPSLARGLLGTIRATFRFLGRATRRDFIAYSVFAFLLQAVALWLDRTQEIGWYPWGRILIVLSALPAISLTVRRLTDTGWPRGLVLLRAIPLADLILMLVLFWRGPRETSKTSPGAFVKIAGLALILFTLLPLRYEPFYIPSNSMRPALTPGDYLFADLLAWGPPCPVCDGGRFWITQPTHGEIVTFRHPVNGQDYVKRVIGLPGETISLSDGLVEVNGVALSYEDDGRDVVANTAHPVFGAIPRCLVPVGSGAECEKLRMRETWPDGLSYPILDVGLTHADTFAPVTVPDGHLFLLGDNRDNSADSRVAQAAGGIGMVPVSALKGRFSRVVFSSAGSLYDPTKWRRGRFWMAVQ